MKLYLLLVLFIFTSCASHHSTPISSSGSSVNSVVVKKNLNISVDEDDDIGMGNYRLYTFTLKNESNSWKRIKNAKFEYSNEKLNSDAKIIIGEDLATWLRSVEREKEISQFNKNLLLGSLAVFSTTAGIISGNDTLMSVGLGTYAGWIGSSIYDAKKAVEVQKHVPKGHILSQFSVPPGLETQQWLAIEYQGKEDTTPNGKSIILTLEYLDGETESYNF